MKGYELSRRDSEPSSLPTQVSVTVGDGGGGYWVEVEVEVGEKIGG